MAEHADASDAAILALVERLARHLRASGQTLATAESCTGGWLGKLLTDLPGSSAWYPGGIISYSNEAKQSLLGVDATLIERHGAVSEPVVRAMADGARRRFGTDLAVAVSGIAGPGGGSADKPVGTVWFAWADAGASRALCRQLPGDRDAVRRAAVHEALCGLVSGQPPAHE